MPFWFLLGTAVLLMVGAAGVLTRPLGEPAPTLEAAATAQVASTATLPPSLTEIPAAAATVTLPASPTAVSAANKTTLELPRHLLKSAGELVEDFENPAEWVKVGGAAARADPVNFQSGRAGIKLTSAGQNSVMEKKVNWDLSAAQCLRFWVFRPTRNSNTFEIQLSTKTNFSQYFRKEVKPNPIDWTLVQICQEEFINVRGANWRDPIVRLRMQLNPNDELTFDSLSIRVQPVPVVMIQFDDANESEYTVALPVLNQFGMRATDYVPTALVGTPGKMNVAQLLELQRQGWVVGSHSMNHVLLRDFPKEVQEQEIAGALAALEGWGLRGGRHLAYPWGKYNTDTLALMTRLGMLSGRSVSNAPDVYPQITPFILRTAQDVDGLNVEAVQRLVDAAIANRRILTLVFHELLPGSTAAEGKWNGVDFARIIAYIAEKRLPVLTIDEFVRLADGPVTVEMPRSLP